MNAHDEQRLVIALKQNMGLYSAMREMFVARRDRMRELSEAAQGEMAVVLRGQCRELTAIINDFFKEVPR
jgi:hypothetical protein